MQLTGKAGGRSISDLIGACKDAERGISAKVQQLKRAKADK
jgi:hypothetical protein